MKVKIIFAQDLQQQQMGMLNRTLIVDPLYVLRLPFIPAATKIGLLVMTNGINFSIRNSFSIKLINDKGNELFNTGDQYLEIQNGVFDNYYFNIMADNIPIKAEGSIRAEFTFNGDVTTEELEIVANENLLENNEPS